MRRTPAIPRILRRAPCPPNSAADWTELPHLGLAFVAVLPFAHSLSTRNRWSRVARWRPAERLPSDCLSHRQLPFAQSFCVMSLVYATSDRQTATAALHEISAKSSFVIHLSCKILRISGPTSLFSAILLAHRRPYGCLHMQHTRVAVLNSVHNGNSLNWGVCQK